MVCATSAHAQSSADSGRPSTGPQRLTVPILVWAAGAAADQVTTYQFSTRYRGMIREQNPMLRGLDRHPVWLVTAGSALDVGSGVLAYRLLRGHPRVARTVYFGAAAFRVYLAGHNLHMMRIADGLRGGAISAGASQAPF